MVIATHKKHLLPLATRIVVVGGSKILMDSPRDEVLKQLKDHAPMPNPQQVQAA
jgi:ABC-type bacteriocin/lantibiotic exporter with double-glycine peptidase domain